MVVVIVLLAVLLLVKHMVLARTHGLGRQNVVDLVTTGMLVSPFLDCAEHIPLEVNSFVAKGGMMESLEYIVADFVDRDGGILPGIQDAGNCVLQDRDRDTSCARVEDIGEVILCEHTVGGIGAARVVPRFVLGPSTGGDDARGSVLELLRDSFDDGTDKGCEKAQDERSQGFADVVQQLFKPRDLGNTTADSLDNLVAELQDRIDAARGLDGIKVGAHTRHNVLVGAATGPRTLPSFVFALLGLRLGLQVASLRRKSIPYTRELGNQGDEVARALAR